MKKISIVFLAGLSFLFSGVVFANNHSDTGWSATLPRFQGNYYTGARKKTDTSSGWVTLGAIGKGGINAWMQLANGTEVNSPKRNLHVGQGRYISNYAYEWYGATNVRMAIESDYVNVVRINASGVWSPDSI